MNTLVSFITPLARLAGQLIASLMPSPDPIEWLYPFSHYCELSRKLRGIISVLRPARDIAVYVSVYSSVYAATQTQHVYKDINALPD